MSAFPILNEAVSFSWLIPFIFFLMSLSECGCSIMNKRKESSRLGSYGSICSCQKESIFPRKWFSLILILFPVSILCVCDCCSCLCIVGWERFVAGNGEVYETSEGGCGIRRSIEGLRQLIKENIFLNFFVWK